MDNSDAERRFGELNYEEMKERAKRKSVELMMLFEQMRRNRQMASEEIVTGALIGSKDDLREKYILAQATICSLSAKLLLAVNEMLH